MARIRTIKPEFWTDEKIVRLPHIARLLFIGLWNFADDSGALDYSPDRIKLQVLPGESDCDISGLIDLLEAAGLVSYWASQEEGTQAITINGWSKHQKIDNPSRKTIIREGYRKKAIPTEERISVAKKYGCKPGEEAHAECYYCGMPGKVKWWMGSNNKPSRWITLSDLEFDHFVSEHSGGENSSKNIVLACRCCNRGKREFDPHQFFSIKNPSVSLDRNREESSLDQGSRIKDQGRDQGEEGKGEEKKARVTALSSSDLMADGVLEETAEEFLALRKRKRAPLTAGAWSGIKSEAMKARWTLQAVVSKCVARGWQGFEADWVMSGQQQSGLNKQEALEMRNREIAARAASRIIGDQQ